MSKVRSPFATRPTEILDVEATTAVRAAEVTAQQRMIDRTHLGLWSERLAADAVYGSAENLAWLVMSALSSRTSQCSINPSGPMGPSRVMTSPMTANPTAISARPGRNSGSGKKYTECRALSSIGRHDALSRSKLDC